MSVVDNKTDARRARHEALTVAVHAAVASIDDPEYPGISIVDLGLLETIDVTLAADAESPAAVTIGLIPTFSGCPALAVIADDVSRAVSETNGVGTCEVTWLASPPWHTDRISHEARTCLAKKYTVSVQLGQRTTTCPLCGSRTTQQSMFGPSRCRSVHTCSGCGETVEVLRG